MHSRWIATLALLGAVACSTGSKATTFDAKSSNPWSESAITAARQAGKPVVILATADW